MMPYRTSTTPETLPQPWWGARLWRRLVGELVFSGDRTCGHCRHWKAGEPIKVRCNDLSCCNKSYHYEPGKGDCKLIHGKHDKWADERCPADNDRFQPKRKYMHRVKR